MNSLSNIWLSYTSLYKSTHEMKSIYLNEFVEL